MQTLLLLTIVSGLLAGDLLVPALLDAQASSTTHPVKPTKAKPAAKSTTAVHPTTKGGTASSATTSATSAGTRPAASKSATAAKATPPSTVANADSTGVPLGSVVAPVTMTPLRDAPDGQIVGTIGPQFSLVPLAHDRGWVRVRAEGWVKESDVATADPTHATVSAADLRADPDGARGKTVRWDVEVLALETADPLRKGLNPDEPYLLARGPGSESALLYVAVPPGLLATARIVASRAPSPVSLVATVRSGRSEPVGVPILDAQSLVRR
jgi:hypothetical protein